ncbi:tripartite tricarboxylate transporter substrate binding protein [Amphritea sp. 2_MG-2023]|uniref:Bug family tripartite tricarboxylate transporter substrate binding protein n=1 Tax=Amphritea TaxID=515417 RepID=UPI001C069098|nr:MULTISPECIES: tripartite tricarboxylate transporter substrate binding protein [Amphritea]MBU2964130.1 tripartite tricarboxylate transporter substrate binding protein [Amphritea atlantica]MDO6418530.1 tripartite tricarboxylate transporter substrate binding protein [Amphritea sp. 2_MG-2023]
MLTKKIKKALLCAVSACVLSSTVSAADFPSKDIRLIVPWPAGGGADAISRKISSIAEQELTQSIYVENIGGAVTATGLMQMTRARPDGHTIGVLTYDSVITLPRGKMVPGYSLEKMQPIARISREADAFVVSKRSGYNSFDELISAAKANPNTVRVGVAPRGSGPYLAVRRLEKEAGVRFNVITYPGSSSAEAEALLSGELDAAISSLGDFSGIIQSGDAKGVVELTSEQNPSFPDVPPVSTFGYHLETGSFILLAAPKNTPEASLSKLESAFKTAFDSSEFQVWVATVGVTPSWLGSVDVQHWIDELQTSTFKVMDDLNL